ncbi:hypothetical protein REPUB_Repub17cG0050700 [Reevesia pubescens]
MKSLPNQGAEELMKAKKKVMETKAVVVMETKSKSCICSPTGHHGSFRCQLHRATTTTTTGIGMGNSSALNKLNSKSQHILSRFGRASSLKLKPFTETSLPA